MGKSILQRVTHCRVFTAPLPGTRIPAGSDDYSNADVIYAEDLYDDGDLGAGDYDAEDPIVYFM